MSKTKLDPVKGVWWLPEKPELRVVGEFCAEDERASLHSSDIFSPSRTTTSTSVSSGSRTALKLFIASSSAGNTSRMKAIEPTLSHASQLPFPLISTPIFDVA